MMLQGVIEHISLLTSRFAQCSRSTYRPNWNLSFRVTYSVSGGCKTMKRRSFLASSAAVIMVSTGCVSTQDRGTVSIKSRGTDEEDGSSPTQTPPLSETNEAYNTEFTNRGAWSTHCFDSSRRGYNAATSSPTGDVGAAWLRTPIEGQRTFRTTPPVTDDSHVYVGSGSGDDEGDNQQGGFIAAFDGETGKRTWRTSVTSGSIERVAHASGTIFSVSSNYEPRSATLTALATADGSQQWQVELPPNPTGGPIVSNEQVFVSTQEGGVTAVSIDGSHQWDQAIADGEEYASTAPCAADSSVFVGTDRGRIVSLASDDGDQQWRNTIVDSGHRPRIQTIPTVADGTVFVTGTNYRLYSVDARDGRKRWDSRLLDQSYGNSIPSVAVFEETLYVNTIHGGLLALRRSSGTEQWRTGKYGGGLPPATSGDLIVAPASGGAVHAYGSDRDQRWKFDMPTFDAGGLAAYIMGPQVALAHNRVYISLNDGRIFSLGAK